MLIVLRNDGVWKYVGVAFLFMYLPLNLFARYFMGVHQGHNDFRRFNAVRLALTLSYAVAVVSLFVFSVHSLVPVLVATLVSNVIALAIAGRGLIGGALRQHHGFDWSVARETLSYGLRAHLGDLSPIDTLQVDIAVVVAFLGPREAGLYAVASSAAAVVQSQGVAIGLVALPAVAGTDDPVEARTLTGLFVRATLVIGVATATVIWILAGVAVPLIYGHKFTGSVEIVRILVLGGVVASVRQVLNDSLRGAGRPLYGSIAEVASWITICIGLAIMLPLLGVTGAAVAVVASYLVALLVILTLAARTGISARALLIPRAADLDLLKQTLRSALRDRRS